jgi:hypothetical protein
MNKKTLTKQAFQDFPLAKQYRLLGTRDMVLAKLRADEVPLDDIEMCKRHLAAHTIAPECCLMVFEAHLAEVFDSAIAD